MLDNNTSPYQAFTGKLPNLGRFRVFGCVAWYYLPEHERSSKIGPRALPAINLGCDPERNGWLVYIPQLNRITTMYHGSHQERKFMSWKDDSVTAPALPSGLHHPPRRVHTEDRDHEHEGVTVQSRFAPRWHEAMVKEITDLLKNETWEPVDRSNVPAGKRITSSKWV